MNEVIIPEGWERISLCKACHVLMGQSPNGYTINQSEKGYPFLQGNAEFGKKYPSEKNWTTNPTRISEKGSILLSVRAPVGELNISDKDYCIGRGLASLAYKEYSLEYLYFSISHNKHQFKGLSQGSTFEAINRKNIEEFNILAPKEEREQQKIAEILSEVDSAIEKTNQLIEKNKRLKTALMQDLLSNGIDEYGKIRSPHTHRFKSSPLGDIPMEWEYKELMQITSLIKDGTHATHKDVNNGIPLLSAKDIKNGEVLIKNDSRRISEDDFNQIHKNYQIMIDDILLTIVGTIGEIAIVKTESKFTVQRSIAILRFKEIISGLAYYLLLDKPFYNQLINSVNASAQGGIYLGSLSKCFVKFPKSKTEQQKIADILSSQDKKIDNLQKKLNKLKHLKSSLMQDLLSGNVRVNKLMESNL